jgi:asparagine N-glycosylation enzyme membrane subunit Stt3
MFVREKAGWIIAVMAGVIFAGFIKVFVPAQYVWPVAGCYFVIISILRIYSLSSVERGQRLNYKLTAVLDKIFIFFSGRSLTERVVKLKEWGEKKQAQEKK